MYIDIQLKKDSLWQRIDAVEVIEATKGRSGRSKHLGIKELKDILGGSQDQNDWE